LLDILTHDPTIHAPFSNQLILQPILEDAMLTVNFHRRIGSHFHPMKLVDYM
jgi:hypothetical protein